jgi:arsenate reductase
MAAGSRDTVIYHNPKCGTSRKTLDLLRDNGIDPVIIRYLKTPPSRAEPKGPRLARPIDAVREIL